MMSGKEYKAFIDSLTCVDGVVCDRLTAWVPGAFEYCGAFYKPNTAFGLLASDMVKGALYMSTAFDAPVKLIDFYSGFSDGGAVCDVLYKGAIYTDCSFRMAKYN